MPSLKSPAESTTQTGGDPVLEMMKRNHVPLTLENWLHLNYPNGVPDGWRTENPPPAELTLDPEQVAFVSSREGQRLNAGVRGVKKTAPSSDSRAK